MKKILLWILIILFVLIGGLYAYVQASWNKDFEAPYPDIKASSDSADIARGAYLIYGPAHCSYCHIPPDQIPMIVSGEQLPLSGGWELSIPPGTFRAPNITPDPETGIGSMSDSEIARALRYMVSHDNKYMLPVMEFTEMSDEDIKAIISYLRTQSPVKNEVPQSEFTFLGKALMAFGMIEPRGPILPPPVSIQADSTIVYGSYIARNVANCLGCHTARDEKTGVFISPEFSGGFVMHAEYAPEKEGYVFLTPNITPDQETGVMAKWSEEIFINRFKYGRVLAGSPMPWEAYAMMNEMELKALFRYLSSLDPQKGITTKTVYAPGEELPDLE